MKISQLLSTDGLDQLFPMHEYFRVLNRDITFIVEETLLGPSDQLLIISAHVNSEQRDILAEHCAGRYTRELHLPVDHTHLNNETWYTGQDLPSFLGINHHPADVTICGNYVYISMLFGAWSMKAVFRLSLPILTVAALAAVCSPFMHEAAPQYPKDPRFSEFIFRGDEEPTIKDRTDSVNVRWPSMETSETHLTIVYSSQTGFLPDKGPEFWLTAVATIPGEAIQLLTEGAAAGTFLPGVYPHLYKYVPQGCEFTTTDPESADEALVPDREKIPRNSGPMSIQTPAVSEDCHLLVFAALGHS